MSASSIVNFNIDSDVDQMYCQASYKYLLDKRFKVGEGINIEDMYHIENLIRIHNRCYVTKCIDKKQIEQEIRKITMK